MTEKDAHAKTIRCWIDSSPRRLVSPLLGCESYFFRSWGITNSPINGDKLGCRCRTYSEEQESVKIASEQITGKKVLLNHCHMSETRVTRLQITFSRIKQ